MGEATMRESFIFDAVRIDLGTDELPAFRSFMEVFRGAFEHSAAPLAEVLQVSADPDDATAAATALNALPAEHGPICLDAQVREGRIGIGVHRLVAAGRTVPDTLPVAARESGDGPVTDGLVRLLEEDLSWPGILTVTGAGLVSVGAGHIAVLQLELVGTGDEVLLLSAAGEPRVGVKRVR
ncbi:hypothetical protein [Actinoplanes sp. NPDC051859]|uniref:hypothetical protein n=1 Tax=Actinoplanes sp. NPDC051859 TaxID=3363909 RepID=UPI00379904D8